MQQSTPVDRFLQDYAKSGTARFHMPGHKGNVPFLGDLGALDITEIDGADVLFHSEGILRRAEENAAALYQTEATLFSAGGSTLCIQAMLRMLQMQAPGKKCRIAAGRSAHQAFVNACALLNIDPVWFYPVFSQQHGFSAPVTPEQTKELLAREACDAVYITSPDYMGQSADLAGIAAVCREYGIPLLVDNAHGSHLKFCSEDRHPMTFGASLCCDSAHKTLPVLTGGSFLHIGGDFSAAEGKQAMALFGSTSPSYLILRSLELAVELLSRCGKDLFMQLEKKRAALFSLARQKGFAPLPGDCTKLALDASAAWMNGEDLALYFRQRGLEPEYVSARHVLFLMTPWNTETDFSRLSQAIAACPVGGQKSLSADDLMPGFGWPETVCSPHEALFSDVEEVLVEQAAGRVSAQTCITCPPGIPIVVPGEKMTENTQKLLKNSSFLSIKVLK